MLAQTTTTREAESQTDRSSLVIGLLMIHASNLPNADEEPHATTVEMMSEGLARHGLTMPEFASACPSCEGTLISENRSCARCWDEDLDRSIGYLTDSSEWRVCIGCEEGDPDKLEPYDCEINSNSRTVYACMAGSCQDAAQEAIGKEWVDGRGWVRGVA